MVRDIYPDPLTKVHFLAATGWVRNARIRDQVVSHATSGHGAMVAILDNGYILIDQAWGRRPQEKPEKLSESEIRRLKRFKKKK